MTIEIGKPCLHEIEKPCSSFFTVKVASDMALGHMQFTYCTHVCVTSPNRTSTKHRPRSMDHPVDLVHGPPHGAGPQTTSWSQSMDHLMEPVHGPPHRSAVVMAAGRVFLLCVLMLSFACFSSSTGRKFVWNRFNYFSSFFGYRFTRSDPFFGENYSPIYRRTHVRHLDSTSRGRRYLGSRLCYYANSDSTFQQFRLLTSGDISLNPGPDNNSLKCSVCSRTIARNHRALSCDQCDKWCHIKCGNVKPNDFKSLQRLAFFDWTCPRCPQPTETFASIPQSESLNASSHPISTNNSTDSQLEEDPFHTLKQSVGDKNLKIGHLNINGLLNKLREVQQLLSEVNFDLFGITETHIS